MTTKPRPKTAGELADMVERLSPVDLKNSLFSMLRWQHKYGKRPGHLRQYLEAAYRQQFPRPGTLARQQEALKPLTAGIGRPG